MTGVDADTDGQVIAVVAAFRPGPGFAATLEALAAQTDRVIVVDDGSDAFAADSSLRSLATILALPENRGIAAALDHGIRAALEADPAALVLTMDQDSVIPPGYVAKARATLAAARAAGLSVGSVSAETHNGHPLRYLRAAPGGFRLLFDPMQSGTLFPAGTFAALGLFDEALVIDAVDTDFNLRMHVARLLPLAGAACDLRHELGTMRPLTVFGWNPVFRGTRMRIHYHSPYRTYFITRNNATLWRRYLRRAPVWLTRRAWLEVESAAVCLLYGPHRRRHVVAMAAGLRDAARGALGPMPARLRAVLVD